MPIRYTVLGFKLTTLGHESPPITTRPGLRPYFLTLLFDYVFRHYHTHSLVKIAIDLGADISFVWLFLWPLHLFSFNLRNGHWPKNWYWTCIGHYMLVIKPSKVPLLKDLVFYWSFSNLFNPLNLQRLECRYCNNSSNTLKLF